MKLSSIATDVRKLSDGVWRTFEPGFDLQIASANSPEYREYLRKRRLESGGRGGTSTEETAEGVALYLVRNWRGLTEDDGVTVITYTPERGTKMFTDPRFVEVYEFVLQTASNTALYREQTAADVAGK